LRAARALARTGAVAALVGALLLAGCGEGGSSDTDRQQAEEQVESAVREARMKAMLKVKIAERKRLAEHPGQVLAPAKYTGVLASRYESDREVCKALPPEELAAELGLDEGSDPEAIAEAYAKPFTGKYREPAFEGCLAGLE
jgi:hypothetical protein